MPHQKVEASIDLVPLTDEELDAVAAGRAEAKADAIAKAVGIPVVGTTSATTATEALATFSLTENSSSARSSSSASAGLADTKK